MRRNVLRLLALIGATVVAVAAWVAGAALDPGLVGLALVALGAFLVSGLLLLRVADTGAGPEARRRRLVWLVAGAGVYVAIAQLTVGSPPPRTLDPLPVSDGVGFWTLSDGARLAYRGLPPEGDSLAEPVVFLHGGPGIPFLPTLEATGEGPLDFLTRSGHPVYYYDQRGAGFSDRLDLIRDPPYTVAGHVADLEEIRSAIGVDRLVLAGHGWGATLATQYLMAHPDRVSRIVALSPAPLWFPAYPEMVEPSARARLTEVQASALAVMERPSVRLLVGRLTATTSRSAAHTLVDDWEADQWWTGITEASIRLRQPNLTCSEQAQARLPPQEGLGYFAYSYTLEDALGLPDPRPALGDLAVPVLIVRGFCDYIRWQVAYEYVQVLPDARQVSAAAGGHLLWVEQPEILQTVMLPFLAGEVVPLAYYHPGRGGGG
jgi:pimeloyl-ACP methyl ester carboxylesterase